MKGKLWLATAIALCTVASALATGHASAQHKFANLENAGPPEANGTRPGPFERIRAAAERHGHRESECNLNPDRLAALMLSITWAESTEDPPDVTETPHPMTLSRFDTTDVAVADGSNRNLFYDPNGDGNINDHHRVYWHPGLGMWQLDDPEPRLGGNLASGRFRPYDTVAKWLAQFCSALQSNNYDVLFQPWHACGEFGQVCKPIYDQLFDGQQLRPQVVDQIDNELVDYWGGIDQRRCKMKRPQEFEEPRNPEFNCYYVDAETAGNAVPAFRDWITYQNNNYNGGPNGEGLAPLARPFYILTTKKWEQAKRENRIWFEEDVPNLGHDVTAGRDLGDKARVEVEFTPYTSMCWIAQQEGNC